MLLIGDSIANFGSGYAGNVRQLLGPTTVPGGTGPSDGGPNANAAVSAPRAYPQGNGFCGSSFGVLDCAGFWLGEELHYKWDVIHFNFGLHDLKYMGPNGENLYPKEKGGKVQVPLADYEKNLHKLVARMKKSAKKLVWRNTTPVPPGSKGRYVGDSVKFNEAAARVMKKHGVPTLDLYTPSKKNMKEWMREANVHYFPDGSQALAEIVAKDVLERLKD